MLQSFLCVLHQQEQMLFFHLCGCCCRCCWWWTPSRSWVWGLYLLNLQQIPLSASSRHLHKIDLLYVDRIIEGQTVLDTSSLMCAVFFNLNSAALHGSQFCYILHLLWGEWTGGSFIVGDQPHTHHLEERLRETFIMCGRRDESRIVKISLYDSFSYKLSKWPMITLFTVFKYLKIKMYLFTAIWGSWVA